MKPIYFPYTFVSDSVAEALTACFGPFIVYQPTSADIPEKMQSWIDNGIMKVRIPVADDEEKFKTAIRNFENWVNIHLEGPDIRAASLKTLQSSLPLFDRHLSSHVVTEIRTQTRGGTTAKSSDLLLTARIFLYFAQKFDRQSREVDQDLKWYRLGLTLLT